jgi:methyl-accepting chemotaxis protein
MEDPNFYGVSSSLSSSVEPAFSVFSKYSDRFFRELNLISIHGDSNPEVVAELIKSGENLRKNSFSLWNQSVNELDKLLQIRIDHFRNKRFQGLIIFIAVLVITLLLVFSISRSITRPINRIVDVVSVVAKGDLTPVETEDEDLGNNQSETAILMATFNEMVNNLREMVSAVVKNAIETNMFAHEISEAMENQSQIVTQQSASASEITSTMAELSSSFNQIADHSASVASLADDALENTKEGAEAVEQVIMKMEDIHTANQKRVDEIVDLGKKSKDINKIMEIINNIADHTKLIAFNAALEAASAGEAGKRFGVVAGEIRRLATSVIESTTEIESKINEIMEAVNAMIIDSEKGSREIKEGLENSTHTADKLEDIVNGAQSTADAAKQISQSTKQQKTAGEQVLVALREIDQGGKQSRDSLKQISETVKKLMEQSEKLQKQVEKFKLE